MNPIHTNGLSVSSGDASLSWWLPLWEDSCFSYRLDKEGCLAHVSPAAKNLLGYDTDHLLGKSFSQFLEITSLPEQTRAALATASGSKKSERQITVMKCADGSTAYMDVRERELLSEQGESIGKEGIALDLTAHVESRLSLLRSRAKYRRLVEGLGGDYIFYTHAPDGTLTYLSPSIKSILGFEPDQLVGHNWRELIGENFVGRERADQVEGEVQAGIDFYKFCVEISHADGTRRLIEVQQRPEFSETGEYISMEGIAKDITNSVRDAEELHRLKEDLEKRVKLRTSELEDSYRRIEESEARYRTVVEDQSEFVCRWLPDGTITFVNQAYCKYHDRQRDDLLGSSFFESMTEEDRETFRTDIALLDSDKPSNHSQLAIRLRDGSIRWNHWTNRAFFDETGNCTELQSIGRDTTELRAAEELVQEREDHLTRVSRLVTMGELISGIAHEIHQPLHAAQLFAEATRRNLDSENAPDIESAIECTREISAAIMRTATIIRHLRSFTTARTSTSELLSVNEVLEEVCEILCYEIRRGGVNIQSEKQADLPEVQAHRVQLHQIFVHFVRNAIEAMQENAPGDRSLSIATKQSGQYIEILVKDNGIGTQIDDTERLFDAFQSTKSGRLGMGLSICRTIAEAHGAQIHSANNMDRGMTFSLRLPCVGRAES